MRQAEIADADISTIVSCLNGQFGGSSDMWFRGQPVYDDELVPGLFRQGKKFGRQYSEAEMYEEFVRRHPEESVIHRDIYEWLTLMQHYGIPTRLLDWTTNLLVALYFCCNKDLEQDAALFAFSPVLLLRDFLFNKLLEIQVLSHSISDFYRKLIFQMGDMLDDETLVNDQSIGQIKKYPFLQAKFTHITQANNMQFTSVQIKTELPNTVDLEGNLVPYVYSDITRAFSSVVPFKPRLLNSRLRQQHGCFTFHGGLFFEGNEFIKFERMEDHPYLNGNLLKIRIKSSDKPRLFQELNLSGIREATLFPEMEYQAKEIKERYTK